MTSSLGAFLVVTSLAAQAPPPPPPPGAPAPAAAPAAPAAAPGDKTPAKGTKSLAVVPPAIGKGTPFEITVGNCARLKGAAPDTLADCGVFVGLKGKGKPHKLEWSAKAGGIVKQGDRSVAIGDEAESAMAVTWAAVTLEKGVEGFIVTQASGEPRKHRHDVFADRGGKLMYAFTARDPRGPLTWSSVTPLDVDGNGTAELVLMNASRPDEEAPDNWELSVWGWRKDAQKVVKLPSWTPTVHAAIVGMFATVKEARELQAEKCLREFIVMDQKSAPLLQEGMVAVAYPAATHRDADLALEAVKACDDSMVGAVKVVSRGLDVKEE